MKDEIFGDAYFVKYMYDRWGIDLLQQWAGNYSRKGLDNDYFFELNA